MSISSIIPLFQYLHEKKEKGAFLHDTSGDIRIPLFRYYSNISAVAGYCWTMLSARAYLSPILAPLLSRRLLYIVVLLWLVVRFYGYIIILNVA